MITFSTKNWHNLTYLQAQGEQMLQLMGCQPDDANTGRGERGAKAQGIVQVHAVAKALAMLQQVSADEAHLQEQIHFMEQLNRTEHKESKLMVEPQISLTARIFPLLELLKSAIDSAQPVIWRHSTLR
jgi:hypothetical protein